jgi:hypothetical protein
MSQCSIVFRNIPDPVLDASIMCLSSLRQDVLHIVLGVVDRLYLDDMLKQRWIHDVMDSDWPNLIGVEISDMHPGFGKLYHPATLIRVIEFGGSTYRWTVNFEQNWSSLWKM